MPFVQEFIRVIGLRWQAMQAEVVPMPVAENWKRVDHSALIDPPPSFGSSASEGDEEIAGEEGGEECHYEEDEEMADEEATGEASDDSEQRSPPATISKKRPGLRFF